MNSSGGEVAIIGAGAGGCALAAYLSMNDILANLYADPAHASNILPIQNQGGICLTGKIEGCFPIAQVTTDLSEALAGVHIANTI